MVLSPTLFPLFCCVSFSLDPLPPPSLFFSMYISLSIIYTHVLSQRQVIILSSLSPHSHSNHPNAYCCCYYSPPPQSTSSFSGTSPVPPPSSYPPHSVVALPPSLQALHSLMQKEERQNQEVARYLGLDDNNP